MPPSEQVHPDLQQALEPPFARTGTESEISLSSGPLAILSSAGKHTATGHGEVRLRIRPRPQLALSAVVDADVHLGCGSRLSLSTREADLFVSRMTRSPAGVEVRGRVTSPLTRVLQTEDRAVEVRAELINFPTEVVGSVVRRGTSLAADRSVWSVDDLQFTLDRMPAAKEAQLLLDDGAGYALTHVIAVRRRDEDPICLADFEAISDMLYDALSFCAGSYVGIACAAGFDSTGVRVWERWAVGRSQFWSNRLSWLPSVKASKAPDLPRPEQPLEVVMPQIMRLSRRKPWSGTVVRNLVASLCEGMRDGSVEIRLATVLTGLELLAWCRLVLESTPATDEEEFNRDFGALLERLLSADGVPVTVPDALPDLARYARAFSDASGISASGPSVIVKARNRLMHPPTRKRQSPKHPQREQAWLLALWYLQLEMLKRCGYEGDHLPPWGQTLEDAQRVPWT